MSQLMPFRSELIKQRLIIWLIGFSLFTHSGLFSQKIIEKSAGGKPSWTVEPPLGKYYNYYSGMGESYTSLSAAKKQAISDLLSDINRTGKIFIDSRLETNLSETSETKNGITETSLIDEAVLDVISRGETTIIENLSKEEEYWRKVNTKDGLKYEYWILMKIPKPEFVGSDFHIEQGYGLTPVWKSALVPGWGQFHKGEPKKGWRFRIGTTVCVASAIITYSMSSNYNIKAENDRDNERRKYYNEWSNRFFTISAISGILGGAIYSYNIFDALTSKGAKKYAQKQRSYVELFAYLNYDQAKITFSINL